MSKSVSGLETSDISVQNADTLSSYGVKEVKLSNSGKTATVELFSHENAGVILEYLQNYTVKVNANGELLEATFNRPDYTKNRILDVNHADRQFTIVNRSGREVTITVPKTVEFDFYNALGSEARVWFDKDQDLVDIKFESETVVEAAIEITKKDEIELADGTKYKVADKYKFYRNDVQS